MNRITLIIALLVIGINCYSQNDTLYLEQEYVELNGERFNKSALSGDKIGEWIEYGMHVYSIIDIEEWLVSGDGFHTCENVKFEYRPLKKGEYCGIRYLISEKTDTIDGDVYHHCSYLEIRNKIPSELYYIKAKGSYMSNKKEGEWKYYYSSGNILKNITYKNGIPVDNFCIYRNNGSVMIEIVKINNADWTITKYNKDGLKFETTIKKTEQFEMLY
jgi:hypothetical protein